MPEIDSKSASQVSRLGRYPAQRRKMSGKLQNREIPRAKCFQTSMLSTEAKHAWFLATYQHSCCCCWPTCDPRCTRSSTSPACSRICACSSGLWHTRLCLQENTHTRHSPAHTGHEVRLKKFLKEAWQIALVGRK